MRVAILTHNAQGGDALGNQVAEKVAFFLDRGADIRVFLESAQRLHAVVRPYSQILGEPKMPEDCWEFLSSADLILVEYGQYYRLLEWLSLLAGGKPRLLFDYHGVTPAEGWEGPSREALEKGIHQRGLVWCCDAALVHSRFTCGELGGQTDFPSERIFVLDYPVDTSHFCPGSPRRQLSAQLGLRDASLLLFVGRLAPNKRVPVLIEALDRLRARKPPIHLAIVGDTTDVYELEARRCRRQASALGLADRIHFLGRLRDDQLLDAYRSADLFVMPSRHEGFCLPVIEAMACGLPVVAARAGALPETIADAGLTFAADDPEDLASQVRRVLDGEKVIGPPCVPTILLADEMRRQGLRRAALHERSLWRERFGQIVEELLDLPPRQRRDQLEVRPRTPRRAVAVGAKTLLVPVHIVNRGSHAVLSEGPGRVLLRSLVADEQGEPCGLPALDTPLPDLLIPGEETAAVLRVPVPGRVGTFHVALYQPDLPAKPAAAGRLGASAHGLPANSSAKSSFQLIVESATGGANDRYDAASLQAVYRTLAEADCKQQLPTDYLDVTHGPLTTFKRWLKGKLLGNFKHAYVDVLSRQQSAFNRQTLTALQELAECCGLLEQALAETRQRLAILEARLTRTEDEAVRS